MSPRILALLCLALWPLVAAGERPSSPTEGTGHAPWADHFAAGGPDLRSGNAAPLIGWQLASGKKWEELSREEKKRVLEARERYRRLPPEKQEELRRKWKDLPDREKERYRLERQRKER